MSLPVRSERDDIDTKSSYQHELRHELLIEMDSNEPDLDMSFLELEFQ